MRQNLACHIYKLCRNVVSFSGDDKNMLFKKVTFMLSVKLIVFLLALSYYCVAIQIN